MAQDIPITLLERGQFFGEIAGERAIDVAVSQFRYEASARLPRHAHATAYLSFVLQGSYVEQVGARTWNCGINTLRFHPNGEEHSDDFGALGGVCLNVELSQAWLEKMWEGSTELPLATDECAFAALRLRVAGASTLVRDELMLTLLDACGREKRLDAARRRVPWVGRVLDYVEAHLDRSLALTEVARVAGVHPTHFARSFRAHMGMTLGDHIRRRRVARVQAVLRGNPGRTLSEIALSAGFADHAHLTRVFRSITGVNPSGFRAMA